MKWAVSFSAHMRMTVREVRFDRNGTLIEFAVVVTRRDVDRVPRAILCIDTCNHGTFHRHSSGHGPPHVIHEICTPDILSQALSVALDETYAADNAYENGENV